MKKVLKKVIIAFLIFVVTTILIYTVTTLNRFLYWCNENQIYLFNTNISDEYILNNIDKNKLNNLGENIGSYAELLEKNKNNDDLHEDSNFYLTENGKYFPIAEKFDPLGYSVWSYMQGKLATIFNLYIESSIFAGLAVAIAYLVVSNNKINYMLKFAFGYFGVILVIPQIYAYSVSHCFGGLNAYRIWDLKFYIAYTIVFILIFVINYIMSAKLTKELNKAISKK